MRRDELLNWMPSIEDEFDRRGLDTYAMAISRATEIIRRDGETIAALEAERDQLQDKLADAESSMLRRFDPAAAESTDLFTWITCMLAERDELRAELAEWKATTPALKPDCRTCGYFEWRVYECWFESSNPNRLCVDGSEHLHADPVRLYEAGEA